MAVALLTQERTSQQTKGQLRQLRLSGWIPAILYSSQKESTPLQVSTKEFLKQMETPGLYTRVFDLGSKGHALVKALQFPATKDTPLHIDFIHLEKNSSVTVSVPLRFLEEEKSPGLKRGGVLNIVHYTLELLVPADAIPSEIPINLAGFDIGHSLHIEDIQLPSGCKALHIHPGETLVSIVAPSGLVEEKEEEEEAEEGEED